MRCPYCRADIHDQSVKCPDCQRLLVPKPGWRRDRAPTAVPAGSSAAASASRAEASSPRSDPSEGRGRPASSFGSPRASRRRGPSLVLGLLLLAAGLTAGYAATQVAGGTPPRTASDQPVLSGDAEDLRRIAESRLKEIRRLKAQLADERQVSDEVRDYRDALRSCESAFTLIVEREAAVLAPGPLRTEFVRLANDCLAPTGREIQPGA